MKHKENSLLCLSLIVLLGQMMETYDKLDTEDTPYRRSLRFLILDNIRFLACCQSEQLRPAIIECANNCKTVVMTGIAFESEIVEAVTRLSQVPSDDPSENLVRQISTFPPPALPDSAGSDS